MPSRRREGVWHPRALHGLKVKHLVTGAPQQNFPFYRLIDWFLPQALRRDSDLLRRARMFVIGHIFGPPLGLLVAAYLYTLDPAPGPHLLIIVLALTLFFAFPFALRLGAGLTPLSVVTVQLLTFVVLFASYEYGGASSPFLCWLLAVPLVGLFFLGTNAWLRALVLALLAASLGVFWTVSLPGKALPIHVPLHALAGVGIFSVLCAVVFVSMMALCYASIVASQQRELEREVRKQRVIECQLVQARDEAERASRAKSAFLANMSHELRTPLNAIIGFSEIMLNEMWGNLGDARYRSYAKSVHDSGHHLLNVINDVLDLSKVEAGKAELNEQEEIDLKEIVASVTRVIQLEARRKEVILQEEIATDLPNVIGSARMLRQIAFNLVSNAVKFTSPGGMVIIQAFGTMDGCCHLTIRDTGIGMTATDIGIALSPFGQVDSDLNRKYQGTGLGLPLAKVLTELHGGTLLIDSVPREGTTVEVILPGKPEPASEIVEPLAAIN